MRDTTATRRILRRPLAATKVKSESKASLFGKLMVCTSHPVPRDNDAMNEFIDKHQKDILEVLSGFDRVRFRGTFRVLAVVKLLLVWLRHQQVLIKDFGDFAESLTKRLKQSIEDVAQVQGRAIQYLVSSRITKEQLVAELIRREKLTEGMVCALSAVESCRLYEVRRNPETKMLDLEAKPRKCLHWYV